MIYGLVLMAVAAYSAPAQPYLAVLGVAQDAGHPQAGCTAQHCHEAWDDPSKSHMVSSLALVDPATGRQWLFDATPDLPDQLHVLGHLVGTATEPSLAGVFLTHAHIGHYTGLIHLGREAMGSKKMPVYAMPRMRQFLGENGPWSQLVSLENIQLEDCSSPVKLGESLSVEAFIVPHRDEYSETVGFRIKGPTRTAVYLPDIDKWERWDTAIEDLLSTVDIAYLDGTFFADGELGNRDMSMIPHPFISETMERLAGLPKKERAKVHFIHLNHTNPALDPKSKASRIIEKNGFRLATELDIVEL
jgi:pyrroloquinoline quinone biosynthesis protein B